MRQATKLSFKGQSIYVGMDVHLKSWKISIYSDQFELQTMTMPPSVAVLSHHLRSMYPEANYYSAYEAGYCGYWIHRELLKEGIENIVVNPADVPTKDKEKKRKTDPIDSRKLARNLRSGELDGIYVPEEQKVDDRLLVRSHYVTVKKQTRCKNQIKALLGFYGIILTDEKIRTHWSKAYIKWLKSYCNDNSGRSVKLKGLIEELEFHRKTLSELIKSIRKLSLSIDYANNVRLLRTIPGINVLSAMKILTELGDLRIFNRLDKLVGYIGLTADEYSSGDNENKTGITKRGNKHLRNVLIESSWVAIKKDPSLLSSYKKYSSRTLPAKAIIKIARKMVNRIRFVLLTGKEYQLMQS